MLLVIDIGNTNTVAGVYKDQKLAHHWRVKTDRHATGDELGILYRQLFAIDGLRPDDIDGAIVSSVVPPVERNMIDMIRYYFGIDPYIVMQTIDVDMPILLEEKHSVGADRIVNAIAAYERFKSSLIVVDFGTATTFDAISAKGEYLGGAIAPGIKVSSEALFHAASKLPRVDFVKPEHVIGKSTVEAMQSGTLYGYVGLVKELVERIKSELEPPVAVVATGGLAQFIDQETDIIDTVDPLLTLEGLRLIWNRRPEQNTQ